MKLGETTSFFFAYVACLGLLAAAIGVHHLDLGIFQPILILLLAAGQAFLIIWFQMHVREEPGLVRLFAFGGLFWIVIMMSLSLTDWLTRAGAPIG